MLHDAHLENLRRAFAAQFEPNEAGYLYRYGRRGAPIQVTAAERDAFVATFDRQTHWAGRAILLGAITLLGGVAIAGAGGEMPDRWFYPVVVGLSLSMLVFYYWARTTPARALARRPVRGNPRSGGDLQRHLLAALSWQMLATGAAAATVLIILSFGDGTQFTPWDYAGIAFGSTMLALFAVQSARKWRAARRP